MSSIPGPIPKRSTERRRRNKTTESGASTEVERVVVDPAVLEDTSIVPAPTPNPGWHPVARMVYESAKRAAIRDFYEPTDWAYLFTVCETISMNLNEQPVVVQSGPMAGEIVMVAQPLPGGTLTAILKGLNDLLFTEGSRRRVRIEVERQAGANTPVQQPTGDNVVAFRQSRLG